MEKTVSLTQLRRFWVSLVLPFVGSILGVIVILCNSAVEWDPSYSGFNNAVEIFKVPIAIFSLVFPLVALVAAIHRSEQTAEQLRTLAVQNAFSNYFEHRKQFFEMLSRLEKSHEIRFVEGHDLYKTIFPNNNSSQLELKGDSSFFKKVIEDLESAYDWQGGKFSVNRVKNIFDSLGGVSRKLKFESKIKLDWHKQSKAALFVNYTEEKPYLHTFVLEQVLKELMHFSGIDLRIPSHTPYADFEQAAKEAFGELNPQNDWL